MGMDLYGQTGIYFKVPRIQPPKGLCTKSSCREPLKPGLAFCGHCGTRVSKNTAAAPMRLSPGDLDAARAAELTRAGDNEDIWLVSNPKFAVELTDPNDGCETPLDPSQFDNVMTRAAEYYADLTAEFRSKYGVELAMKFGTILYYS